MNGMNKTYQVVCYHGTLVAIFDHGVWIEKRDGRWYQGDRPLDTFSNEEKRDFIRRYQYVR